MAEEQEELHIPPQFFCPLSKLFLENPIILFGDGHTYERGPLEEYLTGNDVSPVTNEPLSSKEMCQNVALKKLIDDWKQNKTSSELQAEQKKRLESYLDPQGPFSDLLDVHLYVGGHPFPFVRTMLKSLCPFFSNLLSDETQTEFEFPDEDPISFVQIQRLVYNLQPEVNEENVLNLLALSNRMDVEMLKEECLSFLSHNIATPSVAKNLMKALEPNNDYGIDEKLRDEFISMLVGGDVNENNAMTMFNSAFSLKALTPALEAKICKIFVTNSVSVLENPSFLIAKPELVIELVKADFFFVEEEPLWRRLCEWANKQAELEKADPVYKAIEETKSSNDVSDWFGTLGEDILSDDLKEKYRRPKLADMSDAALKYLRQLIPFVRFPVMNQEFFAQEVAPLLPRERANGVFMYWAQPELPCEFKTSKRMDVSGAGNAASYEVVAANPQFDKARSLPNESEESKWSGDSIESTSGKQWFITNTGSNVNVTKFQWKNHYEDDDTVKDLHVYLLPPQHNDQWNDAMATQENFWVKIADFEMDKTTQWQTKDLDLGSTPYERCQYLKFEVTSVYGSDSRYSCVNHVKLMYELEWTTNFSNRDY